MKDVLFRGKRMRDGKWVRGSLIVGTGDVRILPVGNELTDSERVDPDTVGQWLGLNDKNGTKIFEGDVLRYGKQTFEVRWLADICCYSFGDVVRSPRPATNYGTALSCEVVGNIFDNPELEEPWAIPDLNRQMEMLAY